MQQAITLTLPIIFHIFAIVISDLVASLIEDWTEVIMNNLFPFSGT
ncbi:MAG: hypothetical protein K0R65_865 [Crocinitomicaceae bacterium]|jgi:hypothetical protein|nr:hypothetical protein [Crocinitomicaceae bacterium]